MNQSQGSKQIIEDAAVSERLSNGSENLKKSAISGMNAKQNMKTVIQNILKNIKNVFTKTEGTQPNEMLLRTIVIKKIIQYLILAFIALTSTYLGYLTIYQQYQTFDFKVNSLYKVTRYHNLTVALINEYLHRDTINTRPQFDPTYSSQQQSTDLTEVTGRINEFLNDLNNFDIDINIRTDLFFTTLGQQQSSFTLQYNGSGTEVRQASKYTILMIMLEKLLTIDVSASNTIATFDYIGLNFLSVIDRYLLDSFSLTMAGGATIVTNGKASLGNFRI